MVLVSQRANADFFSPLNKEVDPLEEINRNLQSDSASNKKAEGESAQNSKNNQTNQNQSENSNTNNNINVSEIDKDAPLPAGTAVYYSPFVNNGKSIAPIFGVALLKDPFPYAANAGFEFINTAFANFLFLGAGLNFQMGFPKETFPYTYKADGKELDSPCYLSLMAYAPIGLFYAPFRKNRNIQLEMAMRLGAKASGVFSLQTTAKSDLHFAFYSALLLGLDFYKFNLALSVSYDTTDEFGAALYFSYRFRIGKKPNNSGYIGIVQNGAQGADLQSSNGLQNGTSGAAGEFVNGGASNANGGTSSFSGNASASGTTSTNVTNENGFPNSGANSYENSQSATASSSSDTTNGSGNVKAQNNKGGATSENSAKDATSSTLNKGRSSGNSNSPESKIRSPYAPDGEIIWTDGTVREYSRSSESEAAE